MKQVLFLITLHLYLKMFSVSPKEGIYRGALLLDEKSGKELPFNFELKFKNGKPLIIIRNAGEKIVVDEISLKGDSLNFKMPVFDTEFKTRINGNRLEGVWINHYRKTENVLKFIAEYGIDKRFLFETQKPDPLFEGKWACTFSPGRKEESKAVGIFYHQEQTDYVTGTFLTETGDYRYLEGMKNGNRLYLSCFDGSHAFLFEAEYNNNRLEGHFYSGAHWKEEWTAERNKDFELRSAEKITYVKETGLAIDFSFPDPEGQTVSLNDKKFENKPVILQVMGSWCPNCMDESVYLTSLYRQYKAQGLEIIGLAFEKADRQEAAAAQVKRMKQRLKVDYTVLLTLKTGKANASATFPMLNEISAFPTTIFLNRKHEIVKIHTGFSGPATGKEYEDFKKSTEEFILQLLKN